MAKHGIFISHITEEAPVARLLKELLDRKFLGTLDVFASSHEDSIKLGADWFDSIRNSIAKCDAVVVICSPTSVVRPWINFEAGAGWVRQIPVIPLCHSGLTPGRLPVPLSSLQGGNINNQGDIAKLFSRLAELAEMKAPEAADEKFFAAVAEFEKSTVKNLLVKDTSFVATMVGPDVAMLAYLVLASVTPLEKLQEVVQKLVLNPFSTFPFEFKDIENLYNPVLLQRFSASELVYAEIIRTVEKLSDSIKFVLSNSRVELAPDLIELFKGFLFIAAHQVEGWRHQLTQFDPKHQPPGSKIQEVVKEMIKSEPTPPQRRPMANLINPYIDFYETLLALRGWIALYESVMGQLLGGVPTPTN